MIYIYVYYPCPQKENKFPFWGKIADEPADRFVSVPFFQLDVLEIRLVLFDVILILFCGEIWKNYFVIENKKNLKCSLLFFTEKSIGDKKSPNKKGHFRIQ